MCPSGSAPSRRCARPGRSRTCPETARSARRAGCRAGAASPLRSAALRCGNGRAVAPVVRDTARRPAERCRRNGAGQLHDAVPARVGVDPCPGQARAMARPQAFDQIALLVGRHGLLQQGGEQQAG
ncbi:hypothetical protein FJU31_18310 [Stenotrophomonas cyclobalanopsidis]|uniref:Uncharacterized protein n=1 Tax=Stenotrophomonas cyclobalanopsidis TaxID=2771362 RepID=A0ABQ6SW55_9GAMM|nr:hypothetical protein FJU31_18310 [Stenotrophomonas cyclobalanopsidis]